MISPLPADRAYSAGVKAALSVLDLAPYPKGKTVVDAFRATTDLAQRVEGFGYRRYWIAEHHNIEGIASAATAVLIGHVAGKTSTIRVGSGGIMLPNHSPLVIAEQFGTLASLYPGRIDLGLGRAPGSDRLTMRALRRDSEARGEDFPDLVAELRAYLAPSEPGQRLRAIPGEGTEVPIWILGSSLFSAELAARLGLPYAFAGHFAPAVMLQAFSMYRSLFEPSKTLARPYTMAGVPVVAADTNGQAEFLATTMYQAFLGIVRGTPRSALPPTENMLWTAEEEMAVRSALKLLVVGDGEKVKKGLEELQELTQVDEFIVSSNFYLHEDRVRSYEILAKAWGLTPNGAGHHSTSK